jgi:N-acetyltransferase 10
MVRKKLDERIRTLIHRGVATKQRTMMVIVGDYGKDQVPNLHQILSKASVKARPNVLWCYKKELGFSTHKQKRMKKLKRDKARGLLNNNGSSSSGVDVHRDNFELFVSGSNINWCYYKDTHRVLGTTNGVLVLQDFESLTPNLLARTIETVEGGGLIIFLLRSVKSLTQLYTMTMDVHARYRTESGGDVVPRFNERFLLSLANCKNCLVLDDELNILPLSKQALNSLSLEHSNTIAINENGENLNENAELEELKKSLADTPSVGCLVDMTRTLDQARAILVFLDLCSEKDKSRQTVAMTAARGRGKSAAIGLCLAGAISFGYSTVAVTAPEPENLVAVFDFLLRGLKSLKYQEHMDYSVTYNNATGREATKCVLGIDIYRDHKQSIRYIR